jgi:hypothetical protein
MDAAALIDIFQSTTKAPLARGFFFIPKRSLAASHQ